MEKTEQQHIEILKGSYLLALKEVTSIPASIDFNGLDIDANKRYKVKVICTQSKGLIENSTITLNFHNYIVLGEEDEQ